VTIFDRETELFQRALDEARRSNGAASADSEVGFDSTLIVRAPVEFGQRRRHPHRPEGVDRTAQ